MFDPTVERPANLSQSIHFEAIGAAAEKSTNQEKYDHVIVYSMFQTTMYYTPSQTFLPMIDILKKNNHENARIDYLKMDVEGAEIPGTFEKRTINPFPRCPKPF